MNHTVNHTVPIVLLLSASAALAAPQDHTPQELAALEAAFAAKMTGCKMTGQFTLDDSDGPPAAESYTISKAEKIRDEKWRIDATIEYGGKSATVPVGVEVYWAGDTPVIQVTDAQIPTMGRYTARVAVYGDQYAGLWSGGDHGGHMFGTIERADAKTVDAARPATTGNPRTNAASNTGDWSAWRGPTGNGVAAASQPPVEWSEEKNVRWKVAVPGLGSSSPIVWKDRIYVTTAIKTDRVDPNAPPPVADDAGSPPDRAGGPPERERGRGRRGPPRGRGRGRRAPPPSHIHEFVVMAFDRADGSLAWRSTVTESVPHESGHSTASQASASPVTDGERLYAHFGSRGLFCLDMDGAVIWSKQFGEMRTRNQFGEGSSPALYGNRLVINWDHEGDSFIAVLDKHSGEELWRQPRDEPTSWATPVVIPVDGKPQIIMSGSNASRGYDLESGEVIWTLGGMTLNVVPTPVHADGLAYLMSGFRGNMLQAIELNGAAGDLKDSPKVKWKHRRDTSYVPSALLYDDYLYFLRTNNGVLTCLDAKTGKVHFQGQKLGGMRSVYSSPVGAGGRVYLSSREGTTKVIRLGAEFEELATNTLEDGIDATLAIVGDALYVRGREHLYCIAEDS
ncbi:MAG: PQQ-binding-like beta-propeller repeat protein [Planctomycetota bacterium]